MKKIIIVWTIALIILLCIVPAAYSSETGFDPTLSPEEREEKYYKDYMDSDIDSSGEYIWEDNTGKYLSYLLSLPFRGLARSVLGLSGAVGFYSIEELVFSDGSDAPETAHVFTESEWENIIMPWYKLMLTIASMSAIYQIAVLWMGYQTIAGSINPQRMVSMKETAWNMILVVLFMTQIPTLAKHVFEANAVFVGAIKNTLQSKGLYDAARYGMSPGLYGLIESTNNPLLDSLVMLGFAGLMLTLNFLYMVRKFVLGVLITVSPIVAWAWLTQKKTPILLLMSEIVSNGFMSLSHAIVLAFYASMVTYSGDGMFSTWWAKLFAISLLIPVSALLRRFITGWLNLIGIDEERYAKIANSGLGGLFATAAIISGAMGGVKGYGKPPTPRPNAPKSTGGDIGTKASSSINAFSGIGSKDLAVQSASSWMASKSVDKIDNLSPAETNLMVDPDTGIKTGTEVYGGSLPHNKWGEMPSVKSDGVINVPIDDNVFLGPLGTSTETYARSKIKCSEEKSSVHFTIPDPSSKAKEKSIEPCIGGIKPGTEIYGGKLPKKYEAPSATQGRETGITRDSNVFLGPAGASTRTYYSEEPEPASIQPDITTPDSVQDKKWSTLEETANFYNKALPIISTVGTVYGAIAGTAFGLPSGIPKSYQLAGAGTGRQAAHGVGNILNKANRRANPRKTTLDKPSIR